MRNSKFKKLNPRKMLPSKSNFKNVTKINICSSNIKIVHFLIFLKTISTSPSPKIKNNSILFSNDSDYVNLLTAPTAAALPESVASNHDQWW